MLRWFGLDEVPADRGPGVITLGNFDGVHRGHVAVLSRVVAEARARGAAALAVTFDPHPLQVLHPERAPVLITGLEQRLDLMAGTGLDAVLVQPFTADLALWSPEQYVETVFVRALGARAVVIGHDVRFGHRNSGDISTLRRLGAAHGFDVVPLDDLGAAGGDRRWSSTWVRDLLAEGDVAGAAEALGRLHSVHGEVVHGDKRGRELGFPTANIGAAGRAGMVPADGVYAGWLTDAGGRRMPGAISIGTNPQFDGVERRVETYVLDTGDAWLDLYGQQVGVEFAHRLRPTLRFSSVDELVGQMGRDVQAARGLLAGEVTDTSRG